MEKKSKKDNEEKELLKAAKKFLKKSMPASFYSPHYPPSQQKAACVRYEWRKACSNLPSCAELKADEGQPAEDKTPLGKDEHIEEITADDYFIKNAEVSSACAPTLLCIVPWLKAGIRATLHCFKHMQAGNAKTLATDAHLHLLPAACAEATQGLSCSSASGSGCNRACCSTT